MLQSMGSQRVRHDLETEQQQQIYNYHFICNYIYKVISYIIKFMCVILYI